MAKQPKMDGAQNRQGQDTELGEEGGGRQGGGGANEGRRKDQPLPLELTVNPSPHQCRRGPAKSLFQGGWGGTSIPSYWRHPPLFFPHHLLLTLWVFLGLKTKCWVNDEKPGRPDSFALRQKFFCWSKRKGLACWLCSGGTPSISLAGHCLEGWRHASPEE